MNHPPNIDEIGNLVLLRQALDILVAQEGMQRSLYPEDRDPAREMTRLFLDAWHRVRPVFWPLLPGEARSSLDQIGHALETPADWGEIRRLATVASAGLPGASRSREPRRWLDQIVRSDTRLRLRRQCADADEPGRQNGRTHSAGSLRPGQ